MAVITDDTRRPVETTAVPGSSDVGARPPSRQYERLRLAFLFAATGFVLVLAVAVLVTGSGAPGSWAVVGLLLLLIASLWYVQRTGRRPLAFDLFDAVVIVAVGRTGLDAHAVELVFVALLGSASTYRHRFGRVFLFACYAFAVTATAVAGGESLVAAVAGHWPRLAVAVLVAVVFECLVGVAEGASRVERDAASRERHVQRLLAHSTDAVTVLDAGHTICFETPGSRILGWMPEELAGRPIVGLAHPEDAGRLRLGLERAGVEPGTNVSVEWRALHRGGDWVHLETIITNLLDDDDVAGFLLNSRDVSERRTLEERLAHQALHDPLTALANRTLFVDRVAHALERSRRRSTPPAVCFFDLHGFKQVNETYGREVGDQVLAIMAERIRASLREGDTAARFGGDTFAVLMEDVEDAQVEAVVERLHAVLRRPVVNAGRSLQVLANTGFATPQPDWSARELLQAAETALAVAKAEGAGSWRRHDDTLPRPGAQDGLLEALEQALDNDELRLQYQPVVNLESGAIGAVEALLRWHHPEMGLIPPNDFIPLAERSGLIVPIGMWVLETAIRQLAAWHRTFPGQPALAVHVNVSAVQLAHPDTVERVGEVIRQSGVDARHVTLEITESVLVADPATAAAQLARLKELGLRLAIDDFGVGYAGIGYLREFAVDQLKIDKSFVDSLTAQGDTELFEAMLGFSQAFRLETVAEGVEHAEQAEILARLGCVSAQGFHFARPLDPGGIEALLGGE